MPWPTHAVTNQAPELQDYNLFTTDAALADALAAVGIPLVLRRGSASEIVPEVVSRSDMIALVPRRFADSWSDRLQVLEPPLTIPGFTVASVWHDRATYHPAQRWLRERLTTLAAEG